MILPNGSQPHLKAIQIIVEAERRATLIVIFSGDPDFVEMLYHRFNG
jgi:hypothetical protein